MRGAVGTPWLVTPSVGRCRRRGSVNSGVTRTPGTTEGRGNVRMRDGEDTVTVRLFDAATVSGKVVDEDGRAVGTSP